MKRTTIIAGAILLLIQLPVTGQAQVLDWLTSFIPAWGNGNANGNAPNVSGTGLNLATTITISNGTFEQALGNSGALTPTVSGATFTVPGSPTRLQITPNFTSNTGYVNVVMSYTLPITNVSFRIADIDKNNSISSTYFDQVTVTGSDGVNTYNPTITRYSNADPSFLVISGNSARVNTGFMQGGNSASDATDQLGTINVSFGSAQITSITVRYDNAPGAQPNPAMQAIAIGSVSFTQTTLPVKFISFTGSQQDNDVLLKWSTAQEIGSDRFIVERNTGNNWEPIGTIAAVGTTDWRTDYSFKDVNPARTTLLYRLKQTDFDGRYTYSPVVRISNKTEKVELVSYPNPFAEHVNVSVYSKSDQPVTTSITDAAGKRVMSAERRLYRGNNNFSMTGLDKLSPGIYFITITDEEKNSLGHSRLVKY